MTLINIPTPWTDPASGLTRRDFGKRAGAASAMAVAPSWLWGSSAPDLVLILMADLHSGYAYTAALLESVKTVISGSPNSQVRIVVNGDVFESGNFLSSADPTNLGGIDLSMLRSFANLAPTIVTIGNHDGDIFDPEVFAASLATIAAGASDSLQLVSDIGDTRKNNALYGLQTTSFTVRGYVVKVTSIGTPGNSYANNALYYRPDPASYAAALFPSFYTPSDFHLALVHSGFLSDTAVLPSLKPPFLLHGAHDHLRFTQPLANGQGLHLHAGYWSNGLAVVGLSFSSSGVQMQTRQIQLSRTSPADTALAAAIATARATFLNAGNNPVIGATTQSYDLDTAVLHAVEVVRKAAGADIGFLSHTTFGDGLPQGLVTKLDLNAFVRFPGGFKTANISGATLLTKVLPRCNQFGNFPYALRTGDFLYTTASGIDPSRTYRCVVNAYAASAAYFGTPSLVFADGTTDPQIATLELRTAVSAALAAGTF
jgi:2',3'-cyclic-nucleotide 2'-phosphodiesterase (5'-nucleotidase family)